LRIEGFLTQTRSIFIGIAFACLAFAAGCSKGTASRSPASNAPAASPPKGSAQTISGPVVETMDASSYTYILVRTDKGDIWAASQRFPVKAGDRVVVPLETPMSNFHSQSLNRDFPLIYFASHITREGDQPPVAASGEAMPGLMSSHGGGTPPAPQVTEEMPPPAGGMSIVDVWKKRQSLAGKTVTIRGKVVKFNGGILGRNWLHLQDGSGKRDDGTNDITVTTGEEAMVNVGDTITVTGTVAIDKDFTAGYAYPVMIENASVRK
jgi:hypothetical protein